MQVGSLVQYTAREGEEPSPAIIMRIWPEGNIELHVFHFESATHIRAADPSQVVPVLDASQIEEILQEFTGLGQRISDLENEMEELRQMLRAKRRDEPEQVVGMVGNQPLQIDASLLDDLDAVNSIEAAESSWALPVLEPTNKAGHSEEKQTKEDDVEVQSDDDVQERTPSVESTAKHKARKAWPR